ncbi:MAG: GNAT family N-acetyltransferase, partial [Alphaproteobacteria bacterium]
MHMRMAPEDRPLAFAGCAALPAWLRAQVARRPAATLFEEPGWFDLIEACCTEPGARPLVLASRDGGVVAMLREGAGASSPRLRSWTNFYSCDYAPLLGSLPWRAQAEAFAAILAARRPRVATLALDSMRADRVDVPVLEEALRARGWAVRVRDMPPNRFEHVAGLSWDAYLASRDGALRATILRAGRRFLRQPRATLRIAREGREAEDALAGYLDVHRRSWKEPEPQPLIRPGLVRRLARSGRLRLGVASIDGRAVASRAAARATWPSAWLARAGGMPARRAG